METVSEKARRSGRSRTPETRISRSRKDVLETLTGGGASSLMIQDMGAQQVQICSSGRRQVILR